MNDMIVDNLIGVAKPYAKKITKTNLGSGTSSTAIQGIVKGTTSKPKKVPHSIIVDKVQAGGSQFSLSSLLALMNNKLSETVAQKMGLPRLVYRTGRFANSVRVVNIQETKQGFPVISYTYQRNPYDVFDPVLGASPWNTPSRDPKEIITISVREVAKELALGRFFVKRAG